MTAIAHSSGGNTTSAGIGGATGGGENITINGGMVTAKGTGAGIGGSPGKNITINGGTVTAQGSSGAGIGGSECTSNSSCENITINDGIVLARGIRGAGVGSALCTGEDMLELIGHCKNISINGGTVVAMAINSSYGGKEGTAIGGFAGRGENIAINGGTVFVQYTHSEFDYPTELIGSGYGAPAATGTVISPNAKVFFNLSDAAMPEDCEGMTIMTPETAVDRTLVGGIAEWPAGAQVFALTNAADAATGTITVNGASVPFANKSLWLAHDPTTQKLTLTDTMPGIQVGDEAYAFVGNGLCTVEGVGDMWSYETAGASPLWEYRSAITNLVVESGVTGVGSRFFENMWWLRDVALGAGVTNVGERAFKKCYGLTNVTAAATRAFAVGSWAFSGSHSLQALAFAGAPSFGTESYTMQTAIYMRDGIPEIYPIPRISVAGLTEHILATNDLTLPDAQWTDVTDMSGEERKAYHFFKIVLK